MPRAIWSGALTFGLVNVPVKLFTAVTQKEVHFNMLHAKDGARIRMKRFCSAEDREVPYEEIVKGFEIGKERYVTITEEELAALDPKATRTIEIRDFVDLADIDPIFYESTYYLVPDKTAAKAYRLLVDAMRHKGKVAIASFVLRTREALCCVRPIEEALAVSTMNRADEIVPVSSLEVPHASEPSERELQMAEQLVESLSAPFEPARYPDVHRERVLALVEKKGAGEVIEPAAAEEAPARVVSLADALSASLAAARRRGDEGAARAEPSHGARHHPPAAAARTARRPGKKKRA
ncbi:MAG TPA: Ku protein [Anaeromyxobacter sp.]